MTVQAGAAEFAGPADPIALFANCSVVQASEVGEVPPCPPVFGLTVRDILRGAVLSVTGEVDIATSPILFQALCEVLCEGAKHHLVCDLTDVSFLDASGLRALVMCRRLTEAAGVQLDLVCPRGSPPGRLVVLTGLDATFALHESLSMAMSPALAG